MPPQSRRAAPPPPPLPGVSWRLGEGQPNAGVARNAIHAPRHHPRCLRRAAGQAAGNAEARLQVIIVSACGHKMCLKLPPAKELPTQSCGQRWEQEGRLPRTSGGREGREMLWSHQWLSGTGAQSTAGRGGEVGQSWLQPEPPHSFSPLPAVAAGLGVPALLGIRAGEGCVRGAAMQGSPCQCKGSGLAPRGLCQREKVHVRGTRDVLRGPQPYTAAALPPSLLGPALTAVRPPWLSSDHAALWPQQFLLPCTWENPPHWVGG